MEKQDKQSSKYKVRTAFNNKPDKGKKFTQLSLTVPDQAIPLQVLLERHTKGMPLGAAMRTPLYEDEEAEFGGINIKTLDLSELHELKKISQQRIEDLQFELAKNKKLKDEDNVKKWQETERQRIKAELLKAEGSSNSKTPTGA